MGAVSGKETRKTGFIGLRATIAQVKKRRRGVGRKEFPARRIEHCHKESMYWAKKPITDSVG